MALEITFTGPTSTPHSQEQEIQITANVADSETMLAPESTISYNWSVPTGQGELIGATNEQTVTYRASNIPGNNPTTAAITCTINEEITLTYIIEGDIARTLHSEEIDLGNANWESGFATEDRLYFIDDSSNTAVAYDHDRNRVSEDDISLGNGSWEGGLATEDRLYIVDDSSNTARAYRHNRDSISTDDINLGSGGWDSGFATTNRLYFINDNNDTAVAYDHDRNRISEDDISLGNGSWDSGFATEDRLYFVNDSNDTAVAYDHNGNRISEDDINLVSGSWDGAFATEDKLYLINDSTNIVLIYDLNKIRNIDLGSGNWKGGLAAADRLYFIDDTSNTAVAYDHDRNRVSEDDISLGDETWEGGLTTADRFYLIDDSNETAVAYDHDRNRISEDDINLDSGNWNGGFATEDRLYLINSRNDTAIAYDHNRNRVSEDDINLDSGVWNGGFATEDRLYFIDDSPNTAVAYDHNGNRVGEDDINLGNGTWNGGFTVEISTNFQSNTHTINITPNTAPVVTLDLPFSIQSGTPAEVTANIEDTEEEEITRVEWSVTPPEIGTFDTPIVLNPDKVIGENYVTITTNFNPTEGETGTATITCTATDSDGQVGSAKNDIQVRAATTPTVTFIMPTVDTGTVAITAGTTTDIEIEVTDDDDTLDIIWRLINDTTNETTSAPFNPAHQQLHISARTTIIIDFSAPLDTGRYRVQVEATDSFGNRVTEELTIEIVSQAEGIQQFFTNNNNVLTREWTERNRIFQSEIFTTTANTKIQQVWIRNSNPITANVTMSVHLDVPIERRNWITFGQDRTNITDNERELSLAPGETKTYYIKIEIPAEQLNAPNTPEVFPLENIDFQLAISEKGVRAIGADTEAEFEEGDYDPQDIHYHNGALRRRRNPPAQLHTEWNEAYNVANLAPYNIHGINTIDNTPDIPNESDDPRIIYTIYLQNESRENQSSIRIIKQHNSRIIQSGNAAGTIYTPITSTQLQEMQFNWEYIQINIRLEDSGQVSGSLSDTAANPLTPWVQAVYTVLLITEVRTVTFQSYLSYRPLGAVDIDGRLPEGIVILNKNDAPTAVPTNIVESFTYGYSRAGGNNNFNLKLRADWDQALNIEHDYVLIYVLNGEVQYRGIIDKIRTQLGTPESIEISGAGLSKQLSHIQVTHKFNNENPQDMLIALFDKYISGPYTPLIFYNRDNIDDRNTTTSFDFKNESLYDVINKIAGAAGANPTGRGNTGTDIIWGVDENSQFYFLRKVNTLRYQFHTGNNITFDDAKEAPKFNSIKFIGSTEGYDLENFIPDGSCELGNGEELIPSTFDPQIWSTGPNVPIAIIREADHVKNGSQAYQFPITHDESTDTDTSFRTTSHKVPNNIKLNLSFYARCKARTDVILLLEIGIRQTYSEDDSDTQFYLYEIPLTNKLQQFHIKDIDPVEESHITRHVALRFRALQKKPDEAITLDEIYLYRETADLPEPVGNSNIIALPGTTKVVSATPEGRKVETIEELEEQDNHDYKREVFASDGEYEIIITDLTELKKFGRHKQALQEVDSIKTLDEAYQYGRALLGANANETRRSSLKVTNNKLSFKPYDNNEIKWGYTRIFGSINPETRYEYAIISVEHEWKNEQISSTIHIGAPRSTISEVVRQLTARDRYRGDSDRGGSISSGGGGGGTSLSPIFSERIMPTQEEIRFTRASSDKDPIWIVGGHQRFTIVGILGEGGYINALDNQAGINIRSLSSDFRSVRGDALPTSYAPSRRHPFASGTILKILSTTQMDVIFSSSHDHPHTHGLPQHDHDLPDHDHALPEHEHDFIEHDHPYHTHDLPEHSHPHGHDFIEHSHPLPEHTHQLPYHDHILPDHEHPHDHALPDHGHDLPDHEHPHDHDLPDHEHPHDHDLPEHSHPLPEHIHQLPYHAHEPSQTLPSE